MKVVAIMPIKTDSERLPGKNTKYLGGKPLLQYELLSLQQTGLIEDIYVYCSDESIISFLPEGVKFKERAKELDLPTANFTQIFTSFINEVTADIYVYAHATAPFITVETMKDCINAVCSGDYDSAFCASNIQDFLWSNGEPLNFDATNVPRSQDLKPIYRETSGIYVFTDEVFKKYNRRIGKNPFIKEVTYREAIDINNPEDFELAELFIKKQPTHTISVLDVTLRDGGCVNDFNFGKTYMEKILQSQEDAGIDIIELGYIDVVKGSEAGRTQYSSEKVIYENFLKSKKRGVKYLAMFDYGKFDPDTLEIRKQKGIDGIRCAFHKQNRKDIIAVGKKVIDKGYEFYIQPMITLKYSDVELLELINDVNKELPNAAGFYIVDSFGEMSPNDMNRMLNLVDHNLIPSMTLGFHSHNNLQLSYSNALTMLQFPTNRNIILDCSIMGMGKGAGNLNTELLLEHLNAFYGKQYNISPLLEVIDKVINQLRAENYWGYSVEYYLSSANHCTPSYAKYFYDKHMLPIEQVSELLSMIDENKKISFDKRYAEELYRKYNEEKAVDDSGVIEELKKTFEGQDILLIAPGKSINTEHDIIQKYIDSKKYITLGLNNFAAFPVDYIFTTRRASYNTAIHGRKSTIVTSNVSKGGRGNVMVIDYRKWIVINESTHDSSGIIALNLLEYCKPHKVMMAGFDGFSIDINDNYYDPNLRRPDTGRGAKEKNEFFSKFVANKRNNGLDIEFITSTRYQV